MQGIRNKYININDSEIFNRTIHENEFLVKAEISANKAAQEKRIIMTGMDL